MDAAQETKHGRKVAELLRLTRGLPAFALSEHGRTFTEWEKRLTSLSCRAG